MSQAVGHYRSRIDCSETGERYVISKNHAGTFECPGCGRKWRV